MIGCAPANLLTRGGQVFGRGRSLPPAANAGPALLITCWRHVRPRFYDLAQKKGGPDRPENLRRIAALYAIEAEIRGQPPPQRLAELASQSAALVYDLFAWFPEQLALLPSRTPTADAIRYALNQLEACCSSSRTAASTSTPIRSSAPSVPSPSAARTHCSWAPLKAERTGPPSPR